MLPARNPSGVTTRRRPTSVRPLPPQPLPSLAEGATEEESTAVVETPTIPPRKTEGGVSTLIGFAPAVKVAPPPPLAPPNVIAASSSEPTGIVTTDMFLAPEEDDAEVLARALPTTLSARVLPVIMTVVLFIAYAHVAAFRWARRTAPRIGAQAKMLLVESRLRLHIEWARAAARARRGRA